MKPQELARMWGVQTSYENYRREPVDVPAEAVQAVLEIMEADETGPPPAGAQVIVRGERVDLRGVDELVTEAGESLRPTQASLDALPFGYHRLLGNDGNDRLLIVSPGDCMAPEGSRWGWALQLYSLRSRSSWGIGDLGDLARFSKWSTLHRARAIMLNPLHAVIPLEQQQPSPYFPSSRCFRNPLYLRVEDVDGADRVADLAGLVERGRALNAGSVIDRDAIYALKLEALEKIWEQGAEPTFDGWMKQQGEPLLDFATYASLAEHHQGGPGSWPDALRARDPEQIATWREKNADRIRFHAWLQWLLEQQLESASDKIGIINDVAIGVDPEGADAWLWHESFARGATVGAPPDEFNLAGQNWGLPPFDPWKLRADAYAPFIATIRSAMKYGAGIRIDHVMGLFRLYWIPDGASAAEGTYVRYPHRDLLNIVALESQRAGALVIGEDLGTVEDLVREEMEKRNMLSYRLLWFEEEPPEQFPELALAAVSNHDVPTIAGLWTGKDIESLKGLGLDVNEEGTDAQLVRLREWTGLGPDADVQDVIDAIYELLSKAPSAVVMATLDDTLGVVERPNLPGTMDERPNWSIPLPVTLEELEHDPRMSRAAEILGKNR
jgi:4-alpha-glucanotransferase